MVLDRCLGYISSDNCASTQQNYSYVEDAQANPLAGHLPTTQASLD